MEIEKNQEIDGDSWSVLESDGYYRFRWQPQVANWGVAEWDSDNVKIVAVDGQHRLSALKKYYDEMDPY